MPWQKRCHIWNFGPFRFKFCSKEPSFPGWYDRIHKYDPDPAPYVSGIDANLLLDGDGLAAIHAIASNLSPDLSEPINAAVHAGVKRLQKRLPESVGFQLVSEE